MKQHDFFDDHSDFDLSRPGALIAALPAVLGFVPEKSLVLVSLVAGRAGREIGAVMRVDLTAELIDEMGHLVEVAAAARPDAAIAVIVDAARALCPMCNDDYRRLCDVLGDALDDHAIPLWACHVVDEIGPGGRWHCVDGCGARGDVDDPTASPASVAAVVDGRRLYGRRAELAAVVAVTDPAAACALTTDLTAQATVRAQETLADPDGCARRDVEQALAAARIALRSSSSDSTPGETELVAIAVALRDVMVRDTLYALAIGADAAGAEALWAHMSRSLPDPWRVEPLVLLAFSAYARGDGPLAGLALEAALRIDARHRMAGMLDTALQSAMRPEKIRELAITGYRLARQLGVRLPPRQRMGGPAPGTTRAS